MPRTVHSLAVELSRDARCDLNNAECDRLAAVLEWSEDRDATLKVFRVGGKRLIMAAIEVPKE